MVDRMFAAGVAAAGLAVFVALLAGNLFGIAPEFEDMTDGFRPVMTDEALATASADVAALAAVSEEFDTAVVPQLSAALQMDAASFQGFMGQQFPAVAAGIGALPSIVDEFGGIVVLLGSQQANFDQADQIPTANLPATTMPWILLGITLGALAVAYLMFRRPATGAIWATAFGVVVVVGVLLLSFVPKANAADDMNEALSDVYNAQMVGGATQALQVVGAMGEEMQATMMPALGQQLGLSAEELSGFLQQFPATAGALETLPERMGRFTGLVATFETQLPNYESIKDTALTPIAWTVLLAGIAVAVLGGASVVSTRRRR